MFDNGSGRNKQSLEKTCNRCLLLSFGSFGKAASEEKIFLEINQSETSIVCGSHVCVNGSELNEHLYRRPSKDASYQVLIHLAKRFLRRRFFRNQPIRNMNCLWWPCLLTDQDEISNLYRGHDIDASYQVSVH